MIRFIAALYLLLATAVPAIAQTTRPTVWLIGDSTVRNGTKGQQGWGDPIKSMFDATKVKVENRAIGGRSSRTFRTEGKWEQVLKDAKAGDYVLIQFGHNDSGPLSGDNRERGSISGEGEETKEVTKKDGSTEIVHTYGWYMRQYITEAKAAGLTPIVCSYVPRCPKPDEKNPTSQPSLPTELTSYRLWAKNAADKAGAEFLDLNLLIMQRYVNHTRDDIKKKWFTDADLTHTNPDGAKLNAECVVEGIRLLKDQGLAKLLAERSATTQPEK